MWYKGNLHCHTTDSDGDCTPEEVVKRYKEQGYSFLAITDHNVYSDYREKFGTDHFLVLPGIEVAATFVDENKIFRATHHMNGILGSEDMQRAAKEPLCTHGEQIGPFRYRGSWDSRQALEEMARLLKQRGMFTTYNHPVWSRVEQDSFIHNPYIDILEIYNHGTQQESETGFDTLHWDTMLRNGRRMLADASDDSHNMDWDCFGGYIMVEAEKLTHDNIASSIMNGCSYSTQGPKIMEWSLSPEGVVHLICSPCERVTVICDGYVGAGRTSFSGDGKRPVQEIQYQLTGKERYVRGECRDFAGRMAWTNPIYLDGR